MKKIFETFKNNYKLGWMPFVADLIESTCILSVLLSGILMVVCAEELYLKILYGLMYGLISVIMFLIGASYLGSSMELHACDENLKLLDTILDNLRCDVDSKVNVSDRVKSDVSDGMNNSVSTDADA